jgi:hypothetical protein
LGHDHDRITEWAGIFLNPIALVTTLTTNITANLMMIISDIGVIVNYFTNAEWEKAGQAYADILILTIGTLPPRLTASGF